MSENNLLPSVFPEKHITTSLIMSNDYVKVIRIIIQAGAKMPPHVSPTDAMLIVIAGEIIFTLKDSEASLKINDYIQFRANENHEVLGIKDSVLLLIR